MNNKGEKTFADLFLSSNDDEIKSNNNLSFSGNVVDEKLDSFNSLSNLINSELDNSSEKKDEKVKPDDVSNFDIFNVASNEIEDNNAVSEKEVILDNNNVDSSISFNDIDDNDITDNFSNPFVEPNFENDDVPEMNSNVFGSGNNTVVNVGGDFSVSDSISGEFDLEKKEENHLEEDIKEINSIDNNNENIFGLGGSDVDNLGGSLEDDNKIELTTELFGFENKQEDTEQIIPPNIIENKQESILNSVNKESVLNNDFQKGFDSPFFETDKIENISEFKPLFAGDISLDESSKTKKKVGKIELGNTKNFNVKVVPKNEPLIKFVVGVISYAFFIWLLLIGITLLVYVLDIKIRAAKGDYTAPTFNAYVVLTGSMLPDIQVNDVVVTKKVEANTLKVGDIITFASADSRFAGTIITHRIIKINPAKNKGGITFQTKGDNNNVADSTLVPEANIYGKVILKIPKLGYLQEFLATDGGWIIVILIPCLTVISYDIVKLFKGLKRRKYDNIKVKK